MYSIFLFVGMYFKRYYLFVSVIFFPVIIICDFPNLERRIWDLVADSIVISHAIKGTQTRIGQSNIDIAGYIIESSGHYALVENIQFKPSTATPAITVNADDVVLDLNDFTIQEVSGIGSTALICIESGHENIVVTNGRLRNAVNIGLEIKSNCSSISIENIKLMHVNSIAIGVAAACSNIALKSIDIIDAGDAAIYFDDLQAHVNIQDSRIIDTIGDAVRFGSNCKNIVLQHMDVQNSNGNGFIFTSSCLHLTIQHCNATNCMINGFEFNDAGFVNLENCKASDNDNHGFFFSTSQDAAIGGPNSAIQIKHCSAINNVATGFFSQSNNAYPLLASSIEGCTASQNGINYDLCMANSTVKGNKAIDPVNDFNFVFQGSTITTQQVAGRNQIIDNVAIAINTNATNFEEVVNIDLNGSVYTSNTAAHPNGASANYSLSASSPNVSNTNTNSPFLLSPTRWENISLQLS